ncbi:MAG: hypothetical protein SWI22_02325 [Pseudomonadota bacterium]|nr:hypothetical protein [Pseudomonadota bacterium]
MTIADFIARCDRYCRENSVSRVWLSKRLFSDTRKLDQLADGTADVGVRRLERADVDLRALADDLQGDASGSDAGTMAPGLSEGAENFGENVSRTVGAAA